MATDYRHGSTDNSRAQRDLALLNQCKRHSVRTIIHAFLYALGQVRKYLEQEAADMRTRK